MLLGTHDRASVWSRLVCNHRILEIIVRMALPPARYRLDPALQAAIEKVGLTDCTSIQMQCIPLACSHPPSDVFCRSHNPAGKIVVSY